MGFPDWTLWGMGLAAAGALITLLMALAAQSPAFLKRLRNGGRPLSRRARSLTGFALAFLLLAFGFFLAGVPLGSETAAVSDQAGATTAESDATSASSSRTAADAAPSATPRQTPATGAFSGPPQVSETPAATAADQLEEPTEDEASDGADAASPTATTGATQPTSSPSATAPISVTQTATPLPTATPTPTMTPTPIVGETARLDTSGSTIWLRRAPGGENVLLLSDGETVILADGHANYAGSLWRQVRSVNGILGWLPEEFLEVGGD